jgi:hypothetical protein
MPNAPVPPAIAALVMLDAGLVPQTEYSNSKDPWPVVCSVCGEESSPSYNSVQQGSGCPFCAGKRVNPAQAEAAMLDAGLIPQKAYPGSQKKWECQCAACGGIVHPTYHNITTEASGGCAICAGRRVDPRKAEERMRTAGYVPLEPYPGATTPWRCRCKECNQEIRPRWNSIQSGQGGCPNCAQGFSNERPSIVYVVHHTEHQAVKVGIGNIGTGRVEYQQRAGWELIDLLRTDTGDEARSIERRVLRAWRVRGFEVAVDQATLPWGGYTETAPDTPETRLLAEEIIQEARR